MTKIFLQKDWDFSEVMHTLTGREILLVAKSSPPEREVTARNGCQRGPGHRHRLDRRAWRGEPHQRSGSACLHRKQEATGSSNSSAEWVNSAALLARMNFALALTQNKLPGVKVDLHKFEGDPTVASKSSLSADAYAQAHQTIERRQAE